MRSLRSRPALADGEVTFVLHRPPPRLPAAGRELNSSDPLLGRKSAVDSAWCLHLRVSRSADRQDILKKTSKRAEIEWGNPQAGWATCGHIYTT
jgi:hypothetical protein